MKSEVSRTSGEQILDESDIDYCIRNVSVQTGEEFSPHFLQNLTQRRKMHTSGESSQEYQQDNSTLGRTIQTPKDSPQGFHGTSTRIPTGIQFNPNDNLLYEYQMDSRSDLLRNLQDSTGRYYQYHQHPQMYTNENRIPKEKMKFLCSFGGRISTKPNDGKLRYVGGETRIISIKKNLNYQDLLKKTFTICKQPHVIKYQLPGEDLDSLISVCSDEDFHHMIDEYLELEKGSKRLRIFLEPLNSESHYSSDNFHKYSVSVNDMTVPVPVPSPLKSSTDSITSFENEIPSSSNVAKKLLNPSQIMKSPSFQYRDTTTTSSQSKVSKENPFLDNITLESHKNDHITLEPAIQSEKFVTSHQQNPNVKRNEVARNNSSSLLDKLEDLALFVQNDDMIKEKTQTYKCENLPVIPRGKQYSELDQETVKWMEKNNLSFDFNLDIEEYQYHHNLLSPATPLERQLSMATTVSSDGLHNSSLETSRMDMNAENDRFTPDLVYSNSQTSEDVIDNLPLDILLSTKELLHIQEIHKENKNLVPKSDNKNAENEKRIKGGSISDATMAEIQAGIHGLQVLLG
ncbi:hypothetical protein L1887_07302 [Cichorium endivia]|nr:hypothetical protein L1887_07302 [Cichorium endivia]